MQETQGDSAFYENFKHLTGHPPYPWQELLFTRFLAKPFSPPPNINLPTGTGKTSIMAIWLLALAQQAAEFDIAAITIPRRLVWVVNRRVVVDQATDEAEKLRQNIQKPELASVRNVLLNIAATDLAATDDSIPLAISTLRGEREDNREWSDNPARPSIAIGTVDMVGSRLLFSGYGDGIYWRPQHAGLLGIDALILNDEAHLTPAFATLLSQIEAAQQQQPRIHFKPLRTIRLSATHSSDKTWPDSLDQDRQKPQFQAIFEAKKSLEILALPTAKLQSKIVELATEPGPARTLIYVRKPEDVKKIAAALENRLGADAGDRIITITGTMRGFERDLIVLRHAFRAFAAATVPNDSYWLVATSAAEVGINISSDRLITDLDTLDHLLQRFGRLNRFGETNGKAFLLATETEAKPEKDNARKSRPKAALDLLRALAKEPNSLIDISPAALFGLNLPANALSEAPLYAALHGSHVDAWSQTSLGRHPARPFVEPWLHGDEDTPPETYIAWRRDVSYLVNADEPNDMREALQKYRLLAHEQLREPTDQLVEHKLKPLLESSSREFSLLRQKLDGSVDVLDREWFAKIIADSPPSRLQEELAYCQLVLPDGFGKIENGMFLPVWPKDDEAVDQLSPPYDVSAVNVSREHDKVEYFESRRSFLATEIGDGRCSLQRLAGIPGQSYAPEFLPKCAPKEFRQFAARDGFRFLHEVPLESEDDAEQPRAILYFARSAAAKSDSQPYPLDRHRKDVSSNAKRLAECLGLDHVLLSALELAGELHDLGKAEDIWQHAAGNLRIDGRYDAHEPVAKSIKSLRNRDLLGFRHELASLLIYREYLNGRKVDQEVLDLALHLVAAHHGRARPCFETKAYDRRRRRESEIAAMIAAQRFAVLQRSLGPWHLAYIEALLKAADGIASANWEEDPSYA